MPKNSSLVPVRITDKNGKTTTVYRKSGSESASKSFPPVSSSGLQDKHEKASQKAKDAFRRVRINGAYSKTVLTTFTSIALKDEALLDSLVDRYLEVGPGSFESEIWRTDWTTILLLTPQNIEMYPDLLDIYRNKLVLYPLCVEVYGTMGIGNVGNMQRYATVTGMFDEAKRYAEKSGGDTLTMKSHVIASRLAPIDADPRDPADPVFSQMMERVRENYDDIEALLPQLVERGGSLDGNLVKEMIESKSPSLNSGIL